MKKILLLLSLTYTASLAQFGDRQIFFDAFLGGSGVLGEVGSSFTHKADSGVLGESGSGIVSSIDSGVVGRAGQNPHIGFHFGGSLFRKMGMGISLGAGFTFSRWSLDSPNNDIEISLKYLELAGLIKASTPSFKGLSAFLQAGGGVYSGTILVKVSGDSESFDKIDLGGTMAGGVMFKKVFLSPSYKIVFEDDETFEWVGVSLGYHI